MLTQSVIIILPPFGGFVGLATGGFVGLLFLGGFVGRDLTGFCVGLLVGARLSVGLVVGPLVGAPVGDLEGAGIGDCVGDFEGAAVGDLDIVGNALGLSVTEQLKSLSRYTKTRIVSGPTLLSTKSTEHTSTVRVLPLPLKLLRSPTIE